MAASPKASVSPVANSPATSAAQPWLAICQLATKPRFPAGGLDQIGGGRPDLAAERQPLDQPPGDDDGLRPSPITAVPGQAASISIPMAIKPMVSSIAGLRPARSASAPITTPPTGRIT